MYLFTALKIVMCYPNNNIIFLFSAFWAFLWSGVLMFFYGGAIDATYTLIGRCVTKLSSDWPALDQPYTLHPWYW